MFDFQVFDPPRHILSRQREMLACMNQQHLNPSQLQNVVAAAKRHFSLIQKKYPELKANLIFSLLGEQTKIDSSPRDILEEFPSMVADNKAKSRMLSFLKEPLPECKTEAQTKKQKEQWEKRVQELSEGLEFIGNAQINLRFINLDYALIWKLQSDDLVDQDLTPQTKASIRIVLGRISDFLLKN